MKIEPISPLANSSKANTTLYDNVWDNGFYDHDYENYFIASESEYFFTIDKVFTTFHLNSTPETKEPEPLEPSLGPILIP